MSAPLASASGGGDGGGGSGAVASGASASGERGGAAPRDDIFAACASFATSRGERRQQMEDAAAAAAPPAEPSSRVVRELNPYARDGVDSNEWTASASGMTSVAGARPVLAAGTDGGASWEEKRMRRAVEEAHSSSRSLEQVCHRQPSRSSPTEPAIANRAGHPCVPTTTRHSHALHVSPCCAGVRGALR